MRRLLAGFSLFLISIPASIFISIPPPSFGQLTIGTLKQEGRCAVGGIIGNVVVNCPGLPPSVLQLLTKDLNEQGRKALERMESIDKHVGGVDAKLNQLEELVEDLREQAKMILDGYEALQRRVSNSTFSAKDKAIVKALLEKGKITAAKEVLSELAAQPDQDSAEIHFLEGGSAELEFKDEEALSSYEKAYVLRPDVPEYGSSYGILLIKVRDYEKAEPVLLAALKTYTAKKNPSLKDRAGLANVLNSLGNLHRRQHNYAAAEEDSKKALAIREELAKEDPDTYEMAVARTLNNIGLLDVKLKRVDDAMKAYQDSLKISKRRAQTNKEDLMDAARTQANLGNWYADAHRPAEAAKAFDDAIAMKMDLLMAFPNRAAEMQASLADTYWFQCMFYRNEGDGPRAIKSAVEMVQIYKGLSQGKTIPVAYKAGLAESYYSLGNSYELANQTKEMLEAFQNSLATYEELAEEDSARFDPDVAEAHIVLGGVYGSVDRAKDAISEVREGIPIYEELAKRDRKYIADVANGYSTLGALYGSVDNYKDAERALTKALANFRFLDAIGANSYKEEISLTQSALGENYMNSHRQREGDASFAEAVAIQNELAISDRASYLSELIETLNGWAYYYKDSAQSPEFAEVCGKGRAMLESFAVSDVKGVAPYFANECPLTAPVK